MTSIFSIIQILIIIVFCCSDGSLINREVVKLVTRGTLIEPLHNEANYLLSVATSPTSNVGLAWTDISTSEFKVRLNVKMWCVQC